MELPPFQRVLEQHGATVYAFVAALVGRDEAEDCWQETWLAVLRAYPSLRDASNLRGWVMTIAYRKAVDLKRSRKKRPEPVESLPESPVAPERDGEPALWSAVRSLPPKQRSAVFLRYVGDLAYADIGRVIGSSEGAARQSVRQGLSRLKEVWVR